MTVSPRCDKCNHPLVLTMPNLVSSTDELRIYIAPCKKCLELAKKEGVSQGIAKALEELKNPVKA